MKPARKSNESPGKKKPKKRPFGEDDCHEITQAALAPAFSSQNSGFQGALAKIVVSIDAP